MCTTCGCGAPGDATIDGRASGRTQTVETVTVLESLLADNDRRAGHNREHFDRHGVLAINLMSSPGAGKTTLLEATIDALKDEFAIAVIEGDLETDNDAARIRGHGVPAIQITTGNACHLDAAMVHDALHELDLGDIDIVFVENVGNLVCPASFDLGQHRNVTLLSIPEGDDKPAKYPVIFRAADSVLITKSDLNPHMPEFAVDRAADHVRQLASDAPILVLSTRSGEGLDGWLTWLRDQVDVLKSHARQGTTLTPRVQPEGAHLHREPSPP